MKSLVLLIQRFLHPIRLATGLVMFAYVLGHFTNHAFGLVSLEAMENGLLFHSLLWQTLGGHVILYSAVVIHIGMGLWAFYQRRFLRMPFSEAVQLFIGFTIPFLAIQHVVNTRIGNSFYGITPNYAWELYLFTVLRPSNGVVQAVLLLAVWLHACIGLHYRLKIQPWYPKVRLFLFAAAILLPAFALMGFWVSGQTIIDYAENPAWILATKVEARAPSPAVQAQLYHIRDLLWLLFGSLILFTFFARWVRYWLVTRRGLVTLVYPGGRQVKIPLGATVLEASRMGRIPHASICGGRGRCSTCRVRVTGPSSALSPCLEPEKRVLQRIGAGPHVRLACQLRPRHNIMVTPLLPPDATAQDGFFESVEAQGSEREIAIVFTDLRAFTALAEKNLPYDIVFLLNRYFAEMGQAIELAGGHVDKVVGDGVMALFGLDCDFHKACKQALRAAVVMSERLALLNVAFAEELSESLSIRIGIHSGTAIVGRMGYGASASITAIGDAVNIASRLETFCKDLDAELIVSQEAMDRAGIHLPHFARREVTIRGRIAPLTIRIIPKVREIAAYLK